MFDEVFNDAELMLLGFISLLLTVFQNRITSICIPKHLTDTWLPCKKEDNDEPDTTEHYQTGALFSSFLPGMRRLLADASDSIGHCAKQVSVSDLSTQSE